MSYLANLILCSALLAAGAARPRTAPVRDIRRFDFQNFTYDTAAPAPRQLSELRPAPGVER